VKLRSLIIGLLILISLSTTAQIKFSGIEFNLLAGPDRFIVESDNGIVNYKYEWFVLTTLKNGSISAEFKTEGNWRFNIGIGLSEYWIGYNYSESGVFAGSYRNIWDLYFHLPISAAYTIGKGGFKFRPYVGFQPGYSFTSIPGMDYLISSGYDTKYVHYSVLGSESAFTFDLFLGCKFDFRIWKGLYLTTGFQLTRGLIQHTYMKHAITLWGTTEVLYGETKHYGSYDAFMLGLIYRFEKGD